MVPDYIGTHHRGPHAPLRSNVTHLRRAGEPELTVIDEIGPIPDTMPDAVSPKHAVVSTTLPGILRRFIPDPNL